MIYVIRNINYDIDKNELVDLIKIGYTDDKSKDIRFSAYKLHNPLCKIIYILFQKVLWKMRKIYITNLKYIN